MKIFFLLGVALCVGGHAGRAMAGPCYDVEILWGQTCGFFGPANVHPEDIAIDGTVVGAVEQCVDPTMDEGFVWPAMGDPYFIPRPPGVEYLYATCLNDTGRVGVFMSAGLGGHVYDLASGGFMPLDVASGGNFIKPHGINNQSHTCGEWGNNLIGNPDLHAFVIMDRRFFDLGSILAGLHSVAHDMNDQASVVGEMGNFAVISSLRGFLYRDSKVIDFGVAPGCISSRARAVNQRDEVAASGAALTPDGTFARPFLWIEGRWTTIDLLPGFDVCGTSDLNDATVVVGTCVNSDNPDKAGYVWIEGITYDLNQRIDSESGVHIDSARAINSAGQIACEGSVLTEQFGTIRVGVRLTPRLPQPADFTDDCTVDGQDLIILLTSWGPVTPGRRNANPASDLDGNGIVDGFDLGILLGAWG